MSTKRQGGNFSTAILSGVIILIMLMAFSGVFSGKGKSAKNADPNTQAGNSMEAGMHDGLYTLAMGKDFKPGLNFRDDLGISLVFVLDVSGSMAASPARGGLPKYRQAATALRQMVDVLATMTGADKPLVKVCLMRFSDSVETLFPLTKLDATVVAKLKTLTDDPANFTPTGKTAIGAALEQGVALLGQSGTLMRSLVVISDGENTKGETPESVLEAIYANRTDASTPDLPISTSSTLIRFVGFDVDNGYFDKFSSYGARVSSASDGIQLSKELNGLLNADIKLLEAGN